MCLLSLIYGYVIQIWVTVLYVVLLFRIPVLLFRIPVLLFRTPVLLFRTPVLLFRIPVSLFRIPVLLFRIPVLLFRIPVSLFRIPVLLFHIPVLLFRIPVSLFRLPKLFALRLFVMFKILVLCCCYSYYDCFILCMFCCIFCVLCFCIVLCIVSPYVYSCLFSICVQCTDHSHRVETQLQLINIILYHIIHSCNNWRTQGGGGCRISAPSPPKRNLKKTDFVHTIVSKVVRDLRFSLNKPLKSTDD
jgi:tyrosine kinase 3